MSDYRNIIKTTTDILFKGGIILYPTDTIWGIGCDATNETAVQKIYEIKQRTDSKSMLVLLDSINKLSGYIREIPGPAIELIEVSDKPLTIIYPEARNLASNLIAKDGSIGIRIIEDDFCTRLLERFRKPIVSTSANISGMESPSCFTEISEEIKDAVDYIIPLRQNDTNTKIASSIIKLEIDGRFKIIR